MTITVTNSADAPVQRAILQPLALAGIKFDDRGNSSFSIFDASSNDITLDCFAVLHQANPFYFEYTSAGYIKVNTSDTDQTSRLAFLTRWLRDSAGYPAITITETQVYAPVNTVLPAITGTDTIGQTLTCSNGTWTGTATITYTKQWYRAGVAINGATAGTHVLVDADANAAITCVVTATNAEGVATATSNSVTDTVVAPVNTVAPAITGLGHTGNLETCSTGTWTTQGTTTYAYQWQRTGVAINGATASTYTLVSADETHAITCLVTATNPVGSTSQVSNSITAAA